MQTITTGTWTARVMQPSFDLLNSRQKPPDITAWSC